MSEAISLLGLIGDVHAEDARLAAAIDFLQAASVDDIICTGDVVDGRGCPDESVRLLQAHDVKTVRGNHDRWLLEGKARHVPDAHFEDELAPGTVSYLATLPTQLTIETVSGNVLLCHGIADDDLRKVWPGSERMDIERSDLLDEIISGGEYRYLVNGHMHFRTMIHFDSLTLINAGTLRGEHWPGFAMVDFASQQIHAYEFSENGVNHVKSRDLIEDHHTIWQDTQAFTGNWEPVRLF